MAEKYQLEWRSGLRNSASPAVLNTIGKIESLVSTLNMIDRTQYSIGEENKTAIFRVAKDLQEQLESDVRGGSELVDRIPQNFINIAKGQLKRLADMLSNVRKLSKSAADNLMLWAEDFEEFLKKEGKKR